MTYFLDTHVENGVHWPEVRFTELDCDRIAADLEGLPGDSGYVCPHCNQIVRFYRASDSSTRWACDCP